MALEVTIIGVTEITLGSVTVLEAQVEDTDTMLVPEGLTYAWSATDGSFIGSVNNRTARYSSVGVDIEANSRVTITCDVEVPGIADPTFSTLDLDTFDDIGIEDISVNALVTVAISNTDLWVKDNPSDNYDADSVFILDETLDYEISGLRWNRNRRNLILKGIGSNPQSFYWLPDDNGLNNRVTKSLYIATSEGDVFEFGNDLFELAGVTFASWLIPSTDTETVSAINAIADDDMLLIGVGRTASIGFDTISASGTATISVLSETSDIKRFILTFTYDETVNYNSTTDITANIIDRETGEQPTVTITYLWKLETSTLGSISATNTGTIAYTAPPNGSNPVTALVSCTVSGDGDSTTEYVLLRIPADLIVATDVDTDVSVFSRKLIRPIIDKINKGFLDRLVNNTGFNKIDGINEKPLESFGVATLGVGIGYKAEDLETDDDGNYTNVDEAYPARHKTAKTEVLFSSAVNGANEMNGPYVVFLQVIKEGIGKNGNDAPDAVGEFGRDFYICGVYDKESDGFKISYQEGIGPESYSLNTFGDPVGSLSVKIAWFARGW